MRDRTDDSYTPLVPAPERTDAGQTIVTRAVAERLRERLVDHIRGLTPSIRLEVERVIQPDLDVDHMQELDRELLRALADAAGSVALVRLLMQGYLVGPPEPSAERNL